MNVFPDKDRDILQDIFILQMDMIRNQFSFCRFSYNNLYKNLQKYFSQKLFLRIMTYVRN